MRITNSQTAARPVPEDRNPIVRAQTYAAAGIAPHGSTQRLSYTVPAGKKAKIDSSFSAIIVDTVVTAAGLAYGQLAYIANGQGTTELGRAMVDATPIGTSAHVPFGQQGGMNAGDTITGNTADSGTGGTHTYILTAKYTEYDA